MTNRIPPKALSRSGRIWKPSLLLSGCLLGCLFKPGVGSADSRFLLFPDFPASNLVTLREFAAKFRALEQPLLVNGRRTLPYLREFKNVYTNAVEFCFLGPEPLGTNNWVVQTSLHRRYILRMVTPFTLDATWTNVLSYQQPTFRVLEWREGVAAMGRFGFYPVCSFGATNWPKLVASEGELSAVGVRLTTNAPVRDFEFQYESTYGR